MATVIIMCVLLGMTATMTTAQQLGRRVLGASGTSSSTGQVRLSSTLGQIETRAFRPASDTSIALSQGFQQFDRFASATTAAMWIEDCAAAPGERVTTSLVLARPDARFPLGPTFLRIRLTYAGHLLFAESFSASTIVVRHDPSIDTTVLELQVPVDQFAVRQTLTEITFVAGLGKDSVTPLHIASVTPGDRNVGITTTDGRFSLLGVCREGGPRLLDLSGVTPFVRIVPNPVVEDGRVEFGMVDESRARIHVYADDGRLVTTVLDAVVPRGTYEVPVRMIDLASGAYLIVFETSVHRYSQRFVVHR